MREMENNRAEIVEARCLGVHFFFFLSFSFNNLSFFHLACRKNFRVAKIFLPEKLAIFFFLIIFLVLKFDQGATLTVSQPTIRGHGGYFFFFFFFVVIVYLHLDQF